MFSKGSIGTLLLVAGGFGLLGWMAYTLTFDPSAKRPPSQRRGPVFEIAVFLPNEEDWDEIRLGIDACRRRGLLEPVLSAPGLIEAQTPQHGRTLRFSWHPGSGVESIKDRVAKLFEAGRAPAAVIGSSNTLLTAGLAEALAQQSRALGDDSPAPVLLVPRATSIEVEEPEGARLLELHPGRTFRFCPNNRQEAELVARCATERLGRPAGAILVIDENDPYSWDLSESFEAAIASAAGEIAIDRRYRRFSTPGTTGPDDRPSEADLEAADAIWESVANVAGDGPVWVVLPLQGSPARRMIGALNQRAGPVEARTLERLEVLCGDGLGRESLAGFVGRCDFPIWSASSASIPKPKPGIGDGEGDPIDPELQVPAEMVSVLAQLLDRPSASSASVDLAPLLADLELPADAPGAFGRSIAFDPETGERRGDDLGNVLAIRPGQPGVIAYGPEGEWSLGERRRFERLPAVLVRRGWLH